MCQVADRFYAAVRTLTADGTAKQRLIAAYVEHLEPMAESDVPEAIQPRFAALRQAMNAVPPTERETSVQVSVRKMSPAETARLTRLMVWMFAELVRVKTTGERLDDGEDSGSPSVVRLTANGAPPSFLAG